MSIQRMSHTHEQIINWLLLNPEKSLRECADFFGYTQSWLSTLIHSDLFQARLRERQQEVAARVTATIPEKLQAVANIALEKLGEMVAKSEDPEFVLDAADKALHRMGYAPASARNPAPAFAQVQATNANVFMVTVDDLAEARKLMQAAVNAEKVIESE